MVMQMDKLMLTILSDIKPHIKTPFSLIDEKRQIIFGDLLSENTSQIPFHIYGVNWILKADMPQEFIQDFCFFLENIISNTIDDKLKAFVQGKNTLFDFLFPLGLILIKSDKLSEVETFISGIFKNSYFFQIGNILVCILPIDNLNELKETANALYQTIAEEISQKTVLSFSNIITSPTDLIKNFKDTKDAFRFLSTKKDGIVYYPDMTIERLFSLLPKEGLYTFKEEAEIDFDKLDKDTLDTIKVLLNCDLKLSEAARMLYIHRNTLIYRLDKIASLTGLDLRKFKDAVKMQIYLTLHEFCP